MIIPYPEGLKSREQFVSSLVADCFASAKDRNSLYGIMRQYYLSGSMTAAQNQPVAYNRIRETVDKEVSLLFSGETTTFSVDVEVDDPKLRALQLKIAEKLGQRCKDVWHKGNIDAITGDNIEWAMVYGATMQKIFQKGGEVRSYFVEPTAIGVLNEKEPDITRQEMIVHRYRISASAFCRLIAPLPNREDILNRVNLKSDIDPSDKGYLPAGLIPLIIHRTDPNLEGRLGQFAASNVWDNPYMQEDTAQMYEAWIFDDEIEDFRVFTCAEPDVIIFDRPNFYLRGEHPFVKFTPNRMYDYFWGYPEIMNLIPLQDWQTDQIQDIRRLLKKVIDPPLAGIGLGSIAEEKFAALRDPGNYFLDSQPGGRIERLEPTLPPDVYAWNDRLNQMYDMMAGIPASLEGQGSAGVRSRGHAEYLGSLGASRIRKKALNLEDSLDRVATLVVKLLKQYDKSHYEVEGDKFTPAQFTDRFTVRVDAHSFSPVFVEDLTNLAFSLYDRQAIDAQTLIDLINMPGKELIKSRYKKNMEEQQRLAQALQQVKSIEEARKAKTGS